MRLLLLTVRFPYDQVTEFLDREVDYLANEFDEVTIAPMRPVGEVVRTLPTNVTVDCSLSRALVPSLRVPDKASRWIKGAKSLALGPGQLRGHSGVELLRERRKAAWLRQLAMDTADAVSTREWARTSLKPDLIYSFWLTGPLTGLRQAWPETPLVSRAHGGDVYSEVHGWTTYPHQARRLKAADRVFCVSEHGLEYLSAKYPDQAGKISVRKLGTRDIGKANPSRDGDAIRVFSASSITDNKRVQLIARVLSSLAASGRRISWTHLGDGPLRGAVESELRRAPRELAARLPGHRTLAEVHEEMVTGGWDVFMNLSRSEGVPVSVMEAQCAGIAVVATRVGGTEEAAPADLNKLVNTNCSPAAIGQAVLTAAGSSDAVAARRRAHWKRYFDADANYRRFATELQLLARGTAPSSAVS